LYPLSVSIVAGSKLAVDNSLMFLPVDVSYHSLAVSLELYRLWHVQG
jgi:hypothetical protein